MVYPKLTRSSVVDSDLHIAIDLDMETAMGGGRAVKQTKHSGWYRRSPDQWVSRLHDFDVF